MKRRRLSRHKSRKLFSKTSSRVHKRNVHRRVMARGGIRM